MNKLQILVVEDDAPVRNLITTTLKVHDYRHITAASGEAAIREASSRNPDVVLLDLGLPDMDGVEVIRRIRSWSNMPIIVISARSEDVDKIEALDAGADDYIAKPFGMMELLARIRAVLRRTKEKKGEVREYGSICVYPESRRVTVNGEEVTLTSKEFDLLCALMAQAEKVCTRSQLLSTVWGYISDGESRTVDVHIKTLRQKLGEAGQLIETVRGMGYKIGGNEK